MGDGGGGAGELSGSLGESEGGGEEFSFAGGVGGGEGVDLCAGERESLGGFGEVFLEGSDFFLDGGGSSSGDALGCGGSARGGGGGAGQGAGRGPDDGSRRTGDPLGCAACEGGDEDVGKQDEKRSEFSVVVHGLRSGLLSR